MTMHPDWENFFIEEQKKEYYKNLIQQIKDERKSIVIFPSSEQVFRVFELPPKDIKVIILGQDPYPTPGNANGLAFSVNKNMALPRSLKNIFKEIASETGEAIRTDGDLSDWASQGVFLLNTVLTVRSNDANSHAGLGWEIFTDNVIKYLNNQNQHYIFMLWGNNARQKKMLIDESKHLILEAAHPSPLSASRGFLGCGHFIKANEFFKKQGINEIKWN